VYPKSRTISQLVLRQATEGGTNVKQDSRYIRWFEEIRIEDVPLVGGKNASLGEMYRELTDKGIKIPNGFMKSDNLY
jgi:pyruvate,water dikinase